MTHSDSTPQPPEQVAIRATLSFAIAMRGLLEGDAGGVDVAEADTMRAQLHDGLQCQPRLFEALDPAERELLETPVGAADPVLADEAIWAAEAGQVLLWALERRDLPRHDEQEHPFKVAKSIGVVSNVGGVPDNWLLLRSPRLRAAAELAAQQRRLTAIRARLVAHTIDPDTPVDFLAFAAPLGEVDGVPTCAGDLAIEDEPVLTADPGAIANALAIAIERQAAIDWLLGAPLLD